MLDSLVTLLTQHVLLGCQHLVQWFLWGQEIFSSCLVHKYFILPVAFSSEQKSSFAWSISASLQRDVKQTLVSSFPTINSHNLLLQSPDLFALRLRSHSANRRESTGRRLDAYRFSITPLKPRWLAADTQKKNNIWCTVNRNHTYPARHNNRNSRHQERNSSVAARDANKKFNS